jgi:protein O-mannosyl-transferase
MEQDSEQVAVPSWAIALFLAVAVLAVYVRAWSGNFEFINFDDNYYVTDNPHVHAGLSVQGLGWALTSFDATNWHPLTWLSLQLDTQLFGVNAAAIHRTNVLLHVGNTVLLFWLLKRMTGAVWRSAAVAAIFGLHPVHVEAVAWVTARKDVLSMFFWLLATVAYAWYAEQPRLRRYLLVVGLFAMGLMAKPMLVTLPATLILLDFWPLRRWPANPANPTRYAPASLRWLLVEKLPLCALMIPGVVLTLLAQKPILHTLADSTLYDRLANALVSYVRYLRLAVWPVDLAILYPLPREPIPLWETATAGAILVVLTIAAVWAGRSRRYLLVGWLWFLGTLVPVIGLVQNGPQALADRYTYVPYVGLSLIPVWGLCELCRGLPRTRGFLAALAGTALAGCAVLSWQQTDYWRNSETIWRHALAVTTQNPGAHARVAMALTEQGRFAEAVEQFEASLQLEPNNAMTHVNLALTLCVLGRIDDGAAHLERALELRPDDAWAHYNLADVRAMQGRFREALGHYTAAQELKPNDVPLGIARAEALQHLGEFTAAREQLDHLLARDPQSAGLHVKLGQLLTREDKLADALASYDVALQMQPDNAQTWSDKGLVLEWLGRFDEATNCYRRAIELQPTQLAYRLNLASVAYGQRRAEEALEQVRAAYQLQPNWPEIVLGNAWVQATDPNPQRRDGKLALRTATLVCEVSRNQMGQALDVRAAAHAELGQFDEAVAWQRRALALVPTAAPPLLRAALEDRLRRYEKHQPCRAPSDPDVP